MKRVRKAAEPPTLTNFRNAAPNSTWEGMRNDVLWGGQQAYVDIRAQLITDQGCLCAYCEIDIHDNDPLKCRVEHFHPKSDPVSPPNWALVWTNMVGVCNGGSYRHTTAPGFVLEPLSDNLSCDAFKDSRIQAGALALACEGWILDPMQIGAALCLFKISKSDGRLLPDDAACLASEPWHGNRHATLAALVQHTIDMLNLNCDRLKDARLTIVRDIERGKKRQRDQGFDATVGLANLAERYFSRSWPGFFTVIRHCLGPAAEARLQAINFQG